MSTFCLGWNFGSDTRVHTPGLAKRSSNGDTENESISSTSKLKIRPLLQSVFLLWEILLLYTHSWRGNPWSCKLPVGLPFTWLDMRLPVWFTGIKLVKFKFPISTWLLANISLSYEQLFTFTFYLDSHKQYSCLHRESFNGLLHSFQFHLRSALVSCSSKIFLIHY